MHSSHLARTIHLHKTNPIVPFLRFKLVHHLKFGANIFVYDVSQHPKVSMHADKSRPTEVLLDGSATFS